MAREGPIYSIIKTAGPADRPAEFEIRRGPEQLRAGRSLAEALDFFRPRLIVLAARPG